MKWLIVLFFANMTLAQMPVQTVKCEDGKGYPVHLSFDDGPTGVETGKILEVLESKRISATFLISTHRFKYLVDGSQPTHGQKSSKLRLDQMKAAGHNIGSHSFEHLEHGNVRRNPVEKIDANIELNSKVLAALDLKKPTPFRFPYGSGWLKDISTQNQAQADKVMAKIKADGFTPFHWDIDTWDWSAIKRKALPESVLEQICTHHGGVILMHDTQPFTVENLAALIDSIQKSGHKIVSYGEIQKHSQGLRKPLASFSDSAFGSYSCRRPLTEFDQIWSSCEEYALRSNDAGGSAK